MDYVRGVSPNVVLMQRKIKCCGRLRIDDLVLCLLGCACICRSEVRCGVPGGGGERERERIAKTLL